MAHPLLGSDFELLVTEFVTHVVDELLERHECSFNERRQHWESTIEVSVQNLVQTELVSATCSSLAPDLVIQLREELREAVSLQLHQHFEDFDLALSSIISTTLTELLATNLVPELAAAISSLLLAQIQESVSSHFEIHKIQQVSSLLPILNLVSSRQLQQQRYLRWIASSLVFLSVSFSAFAAFILFHLYSPRLLDPDMPLKPVRSSFSSASVGLIID